MTSKKILLSILPVFLILLVFGQESVNPGAGEEETGPATEIETEEPVTAVVDPATVDEVEIEVDPDAADAETTPPVTPPPNLPTTTGVATPADTEVTIVFPGDAPARDFAERDEEVLSVDFTDEEIRNIILNVAELYDLNVIVPDTLTGTTSIKLRDVTWEQIYEEVLDPIDYTYIEKGNIIRIKSLMDMEAEPVTTRVFVINYANAAEIQSSISPLVNAATGGKIQVDTRSNALVITEKPSAFTTIQEIIDRLDQPTSQVMIESKFIEVTNRDSKNLGVNFSSLGGYEVGAGPFQRAYERSDGDQNSTSRTINNSNNQNTTTTTTGGGLPNVSTSQSITNVDGMVASNGSSFSELQLDTAVFNAAEFQVVLSALETKTDIELVSNPTIVTLNNTEASINIGEEFPIPEYTYNEERGTFEVSGFTFKPIGIILNVTPMVNKAGFINLNIAPEVSNRSGTVNFGGTAAAEIPILVTRKTTSTITIKDGFTLAIGGLIEQTVQKQTTKVPVLGDIPLVGKLFRDKSDTEDTRNLIIFITAKTLNPDGSDYRDVFTVRRLNSAGVVASDVPGYQMTAEERQLEEKIQNMREEIEYYQRIRSLRQDADALDLGADERVSLPGSDQQPMDLDEDLEPVDASGGGAGLPQKKQNKLEW